MTKKKKKKKINNERVKHHSTIVHYWPSACSLLPIGFGAPGVLGAGLGTTGFCNMKMHTHTNKFKISS